MILKVGPEIPSLARFKLGMKNRVAKTTNIVKEGDKVKVKLMGFDDRGKTKLSMRVVDQQTGADLRKRRPSPPSAERLERASHEPVRLITPPLTAPLPAKRRGEGAGPRDFAAADEMAFRAHS